MTDLKGYASSILSAELLSGSTERCRSVTIGVDAELTHPEQMLRRGKVRRSDGRTSIIRSRIK